ncbi:hypothetical protein BASA60_008512 [Batrachochytrium salamandrivorans]|nr:hypothetical protein BASA60_008512 [Batrachochytrium salamandrivorans]
MLSRLIITFLCAAAIGSVSGAFLTFDPAPVVFENIERPVSFSVKLNSKPSEEVTVYFENPFLSMSKWPSDPPPPLNFELKLLAKAVTVGQLPAELSTIDTLKITRGSTSFHRCFIKKNKVNTFDEISFSFHEPGWYTMASTRDIEVQVFMDECTAELLCPTKILVRYGPTVMRMDVSGPAKGIREYSPTYTTPITNGLRVFPAPMAMIAYFIFHMDRNSLS